MKTGAVCFLLCGAFLLSAQKIPVSKVTASSFVTFPENTNYDHSAAILIDGKTGDTRRYWASDFRNKAKPPHTILLEFSKPETFSAVRLDMVERYNFSALLRSFKLEYFNGERYLPLYETKSYTTAFYSAMVSKDPERKYSAKLPDPHPVFTFQPVTGTKLRLTIHDSLGRLDEITVFRTPPPPRFPERKKAAQVSSSISSDAVQCFSFLPADAVPEEGFQAGRITSPGKIYACDRQYPDNIRRCFLAGEDSAQFSFPVPEKGYYDIFLLSGDTFSDSPGAKGTVNGKAFVLPPQGKNCFPWTTLTVYAADKITLKLEKHWLLNALIAAPLEKRGEFRARLAKTLIGSEFEKYKLVRDETNTAELKTAPEDIRRGFIAFMPSLQKQIFERTRPLKSECRGKVELSGAGNSVKGAAIAIMPLRNIEDFQVRYEGEIKGEVHPVLVWPQRNGQKGSGRTYDFVPEVLLDNAPQFLVKGYTRQYYLLFDIPAGSRSGVKKGRLILSGRDIPETILPVRVNVLPFQLPELDSKQYAAMYAPFADGGAFLLTPKRADLDMRQLRDMRRHNMNSILFPARYRDKQTFEKNYLEINRKLDAAGFPRNPIPLHEPALNQKTVREILEVVQRTGLREILFYPVDEPVFGRQKFAAQIYPEIKKVPGARTYCTVAQQDIDLFGDSVDYRVYMVTGSHKFEPDRIRRECERSGKIFWWYSNSAREYPGANRNKSGFFAWRSGGTGQLFWAYCNANDPFSDFNGGSNDHCAVYIFNDKIYSTIQWEAIREGLDDLRYLSVLEERIAGNPGDPRAKEAQAFLDRLRGEISVDLKDYRKAFGSELDVHIRSLWAPEKYDACRDEIIAQILKLPEKR